MKRQQEQQQVLMLVLTLYSSCHLQIISSAHLPPGGDGGGGSREQANLVASGDLLTEVAGLLRNEEPLLAAASAQRELSGQPIAAPPQTMARLDKRSWTPRASRVSEEEARAVGQLLEELASLDIGATPTRRQQQQQQLFQDQQQQAPMQFGPNGRLRGRAAFLMGANGQTNGQLQAPQGMIMSPPANEMQGANFGNGGVRPNGPVANYPKRTAVAGRHMPCFFNAITCF